MTATLLTKTAIALIVLVILAVTNRRTILHHKALIVFFLVVYYADNLLIVLTNQFPSLQVIPNHIWEGFLVCSWSGKLYSIVFTLLVIYLTKKRLDQNEVGLTLKQKTGSVLPCILVILVLAGWAARVGIASPKGRLDLETLAYLAIMPALNEELVYRGYLLGIINKISPARFNLLGASIGWGTILTSILFSLLHGFWFDNYLHIQVDFIALSNTFLSGLVFAWLRERTGSLVMPAIAHGLEDFLFFLPRMI